MLELPIPDNTSTNDRRVCAVVVAYYPDSGFVSRLESILPQVDALVVVDNTPSEGCAPQLDSLKEYPTPLQLIENQQNLGIAVALNQGLAYAASINCAWMLTLDQDTQCFPDMVRTLLQAYEACDPKPAIIGGNYLDLHNDRLVVPIGAAGDFLDQKTVITSGSLIDVAVASLVGGFRDDYFIDQVDHEFCLRVRAHKHRVVISRKPVMAHSVGDPGGAWVPFFGVLPNHSPLRKYYIARNTLVTVASYWKKEPEWCLRRFVRLILGIFSTALLEINKIPSSVPLQLELEMASIGAWGPAEENGYIALDRVFDLLHHK